MTHPTGHSEQAPGRRLLPIASRREAATVAWAELRRRPTPLLLAIICFAGAGLCAMVPPWLFGVIVDAVRGEQAPTTVVVAAAVAIAVVGVLAGLLTTAAVAALARATEPALAGLRETVLERSLQLESAVVEEAGSGDLLSRVGDDVRGVADSLVEVVPLVVQSLLAVVLTAGGLFLLDWRLGLAGLASVPCYYASLRWYLPRSGPYYARERVAQGECSEALVTGIHAAATLRAFSREDQQVDQVCTTSDATRRISVDVFGMLTRFTARNNGAELVGMLLILGTGFVLVDRDLATIGAVTSAALYFHRLFNPIGALLFLFDVVQEAGASLARLAGIALLPPPAVPARTAPRDAPLVLAEVGHEYVAGRPVLHEVTIAIAPGERVALVGETGAGKTTLGAVAAATVAPTRGTVRLGTVPLGEVAVRDHVALVTQEVHVFSGSVRDNLRLAAPEADDDALRDALETVRALSWVAALPDGWDTVVGDHGHHLTAAQAQQLALARVVLRDPAIVVLDEATAEAGSAGARVLEEAALAVTRDRSALVVAHRLTQSAAADRVVVLDQGRIVEQGTHQELVAARGRYAELWAAWSGEQTASTG